MGLGEWIAIVDDDVSVRTSLARLLRSEGILVETFGAGPEFLTANAVEPPACLILDVHLGTMSGFEIQEEMALTHPHVPIIFITAHDEIAAAELTRRAGPNGFLRKPFDGEAFLTLVHRRIRAAARTRSARRSVPETAG